MENYLSGRGGNDDAVTKEVQTKFQSYLGEDPKSSHLNETGISNEPVQSTTEVVFDEKDCPRVEVVSVDHKPIQLIIHMDDGRLLKIDCLYGS